MSESNDLKLKFKAKCLGDTEFSIGFDSDIFEPEEGMGKMQMRSLEICSIENAADFFFEGVLEKLIIRPKENPKFSLGAQISLGKALYSFHHPVYSDYPQLLYVNEDRTFSAYDPYKPFSLDKINFVFGVDSKAKNKICLVDKCDEEHRLILNTDNSEKLFECGVKECGAKESSIENKRAEEKKKADEWLTRINEKYANSVVEGMGCGKPEFEDKAKQVCTHEFLHELKNKGFVSLQNVLDMDILRQCRQIINRDLGKTDDVKSFKGVKNCPEITTLINKTFLPELAQTLLGAKTRIPADYSQVALRFPLSDNYSTGTKEEVLATHGFYWHIDGIPSPYLDFTKHWGNLRNFDLLIGVLLSDVNETCSGELCVHPKGHMQLSNYYKKTGLDDLKNKGMECLPRGEQAKEMFTEPVKHCIGKMGDVVLANWMTPHFIAPNFSPDIRYAVYFRMKGPAFWIDGDLVKGTKEECEEVVFDPWIHWPVMKDIQLKEE